jgi:hypothetical protein
MIDAESVDAPPETLRHLPLWAATNVVPTAAVVAADAGCAAVDTTATALTASRPPTVVKAFSLTFISPALV